MLKAYVKTACGCKKVKKAYGVTKVAALVRAVSHQPSGASEHSGKKPNADS